MEKCSESYIMVKQSYQCTVIGTRPIQAWKAPEKLLRPCVDPSQHTSTHSPEFSRSTGTPSKGMPAASCTRARICTACCNTNSAAETPSRLPAGCLQWRSPQWPPSGGLWWQEPPGSGTLPQLQLRGCCCQHCCRHVALIFGWRAAPAPLLPGWETGAARGLAGCCGPLPQLGAERTTLRS